MTAESPLSAAVRGLVRASRLVESASRDMSTADFRVLSLIARGEASPSLIATRLMLSRPTISSTLDSLRTRGLIVRSAASDDGRAAALSLTEDGIDALERADQRMSRQLELLCERTPAAAHVVGALARLDEAIEAAVAERLVRGASAPAPGSVGT